MKLEQIIQKLSAKITGTVDKEISGIETDSRLVQSGSLFVAMQGLLVDGHSFIEGAIAKGVVAVLCESLPEKIDENVCYIQVESTKAVLGQVLNLYYDYPTRKIKLVGVTGTNGKTTTVTVLHSLFTKLGYKAGLLSTVVNKVHDKEYEATHTTPDTISLYKHLNEMVLAGCEYCFMEVSSHAIHQERISGLEFTGAVFTNITRDHLDYHKTFDEYIAVKKTLFDMLPETAFALSNNDDKHGNVMLQNTKAQKHTYSLHSFSDFKCRLLESHFEGMQLLMDNTEIWTKFIGDFNAYNLLAVYSTAILLEQNKEEILAALTTMEAVAGRFQVFTSGNGVNAIVDYAHTHDALDNVLKTIETIRNGDQKIITVVGAGGDRDKGKRPMMGAVAVKYSDKVIFTADNPRSEDPQVIADEMKAGVPVAELRKVITIIDRKEAIRTALHLSNPGDIVLIAGKGHEDYQIIKGVKSHFDDREVVLEIFKEL